MGLDSCHAAVDYSYPWAQAISDFKFRAEPGWAPALGLLMRQTPGASAVLREADLVMPIPLTQARLQERGFNQSLLLARAACHTQAKVAPNLLLRIRHANAQSKLTRAQRLRNLRNAFAVEPLQAASLAQRRVLLVDDVMTTGATLQACAAILRHAGASHVHALVFARTPAP